MSAARNPYQATSRTTGGWLIATQAAFLLVSVIAGGAAHADPPASPPPPRSVPPVPSPMPPPSPSGAVSPTATPSPSVSPGSASSPPAGPVSATPPGAASAATGAPSPAGAAATAAPAPEPPAVPTADETPVPSDHDAVVSHLGIEASRFDPGPLPIFLRPGVSCPTGAGTSCTVAMGALRVRYWWTRNLAWNFGAALAAAGGRDQTRSLDTSFGIGPVLGLSLLLGNWRHLAVSASPEVALVWFRPGGSGAGGDVTMLDVRGAIEAELHLGFIGVPALSIGMLAGAALQYESVGDTRAWSVGVIGAESAWGTLTNLFVRYYL